MSGVRLMTPPRLADERGWFCTTFSDARFGRDFGLPLRFVQDNHSLSRAVHTLRGIHFQRPPHAQAKLVRCLRGAIFDVVVDLRRGSPTYGRWAGARLDADTGTELFVPVGYGHGFVSLVPDTEVVYRVSDVYAPACEGGIRWDDPTVAVDWRLPPGTVPVLSDKDAALPTLAGFDPPFDYDGVPLEPLVD